MAIIGNYETSDSQNTSGTSGRDPVSFVSFKNLTTEELVTEESRPQKNDRGEWTGGMELYTFLPDGSFVLISLSRDGSCEGVVHVDENSEDRSIDFNSPTRQEEIRQRVKDRELSRASTA